MSHTFWLNEALARLQAGQEFVLATVVGPDSHPLIGHHEFADPNHPVLARGLSSNALEKWSSANSLVRDQRGALLLTLDSSQMGSGSPHGATQVFLLWCGAVPEAWIFGAGHIGFSLCPVLARLGWRVIACDDRDDFVSKERFPDAYELRAADFALSAQACAARSEAWAILVTRGHQHDERILRELRNGHPRYVGMIGSKRRVESVRQRLLAEGLPRSFLDAIHAPIGLPIGADSPMEIAVSIAAEMVAVRRCPPSDLIGAPRAALGRGPISLADSSGRSELWQEALRAGCPVVLATIVSRRGSTPRGVGAQMAILADGRTLGTIGGGCGEGVVLRTAKEMIVGDGQPRLIEIDLTGDDAAETGDVCGGRYSVFLDLLV